MTHCGCSKNDDRSEVLYQLASSQSSSLVPTSYRSLVVGGSLRYVVKIHSWTKLRQLVEQFIRLVSQLASSQTSQLVDYCTVAFAIWYLYSSRVVYWIIIVHRQLTFSVAGYRRSCTVTSYQTRLDQTSRLVDQLYCSSCERIMAPMPWQTILGQVTKQRFVLSERVLAVKNSHG